MARRRSMVSCRYDRRVLCAWSLGSRTDTTPTNRMPFFDSVLIRRWLLPLSPIAERTALILLLNVVSETIRPFQTPAIRSSLLTTRSRLRIRYSRRSKT